MKKKRIALFCLVFVLILPGCSLMGGNPAKEEKTSIKIGITLYDQYDTFISEMMEEFYLYSKEKEKATGIIINTETKNADGSQIEQNSQVDELIAKGCDVICVNLVDRTDASVIIDKAKKADVPVIFFNRELVEEDLERWEKLYYVGAVTLESGILEGQIVVDAYRSDPDIDKNGDGILQYVMLEGQAGHQDAIIRTEYSVKTIEDNNIKLEKLAYAIANWNRAQAQSKMFQWIEEYGNKIEVVLANNDDMALGAIDALEEKEVPRKDWPVIVGIDGTQVGLEAVKKEKMIGTVYNDGYGQAKGMLELACSLAAGMALEEDILLENGRYIRLPYEIITQDVLERTKE